MQKMKGKNNKLDISLRTFGYVTENAIFAPSLGGVCFISFFKWKQISFVAQVTYSSSSIHMGAHNISSFLLPDENPFF